MKNKTQNKTQNRKRVTVPCSNCRRKRAKCSFKRPCERCIENEYVCIDAECKKYNIIYLFI